MLYGRYKCLKSTFQFILTDIGCDKEAVFFFESQGFFLIADRTFSFHDENAYEGSLVDLAEHFFDVLSVENELIYGKVRVGYDMRFEGLLLSAMDILFYIRPAYFSASFFFLVMTDLICKHLVIKKTAAADCFLYLNYLLFIWIDPYFYCRVYFSHPDFLYTDGLILFL